MSFVLALLLPFAQLAAAAHEVTHVRAALQDQSAPASIQCDLCAVAAAVVGGAALSQPPVVVHAPLPQAQPAQRRVAQRAAPRFASFRSRAPPFLA